MAELARQWINVRKTPRRCVIFRPIAQIGGAEDGHGMRRIEAQR